MATINIWHLFNLLSISSFKQKLRDLCGLAGTCFAVNDHHWVVMYGFHDGLLLHQDWQLLALFLITCTTMTTLVRLTLRTTDNVYTTVIMAQHCKSSSFNSQPSDQTNRFRVK